MKFHLEGLKSKQIRILQQTGALLQERGFYLAGGTALAIYYGHRLSVDLDWFTPRPMGDALTFAGWLRDQGVRFTTGQTAPGTLYGSVNGVRLSFLEFRYPMLRPLTQWKATGAALASLDDLACMKLSSITQRGPRKDFCDIYTLGTKHRPLKEMLKLYRRKYKVKDIAPVLYGLSYFDEADDEPMPRMLIKVGWREIKRTIQGWVREVSGV